MQAWRKEWNTRPSHRWIVPLSTERETQWVREAISKLKASERGGRYRQNR